MQPACQLQLLCYLLANARDEGCWLAKRLSCCMQGQPAEADVLRAHQ